MIGLRISARDGIYLMFTSGLRIKTINKLKNGKISLKIEIFFGRGRVHFPFHLPSPSEKEMEVEGEASVKMADFCDFSKVLIFCQIVSDSFWKYLKKFLGVF